MLTVADAVGPLLASGRVTEAADRALAIESRVEFLDVDVDLVRSLQDVLDALPPAEQVRRSRVAARIAYELRGDPASVDERRDLVDLALREAEDADDDPSRVAAHLARVHALWEPAGAPERLAAAERVIAIARRTHDVEHELESRLARFQALVETGRVRDAELELASYARLAATVDRPDLRAFVASRRAVLAMISGRYDDVLRYGEEAYASALEAGMPDADRLRMVSRGTVERDRPGDGRLLIEAAEMLRGLAVRMPGHYMEADVALFLLLGGRRDEARLELARALPTLLTTTGYRWLWGACAAAEVAAEVGSDDACERVYDLLLPHADRLVLMGPSFVGAVGDRLGVLATRLGRVDDALDHLDRTVQHLDEIAALPWAAWARVHRAAALRLAGRQKEAAADRDAALETARALGMTRLLGDDGDRAGCWCLLHDGDDWCLQAGGESGRFRAARGFDHLRVLLANPAAEVAAVHLESGGAQVDAGIPALDTRALAAYRRRLAEIERELDAADAEGDQPRSRALEDERAALLAEVGHATGLGGRVRTTDDAGERARVNVTRNLKRAIAQVQRAAPLAGAHLAASVRTGTYCSYVPAAGGPDSWRLD